jgi:dTDP-4-amino-4,6-dideoxygalactose transaminase
LTIPLVDLKAQYLSMKDEIDSAISRVINKTAFILGDEVKQFEDEFAKFSGAKCCVGVGSGTAALALALRALGIRPGDEVITTTLTFTATAESIYHVGATPRFVDVDAETFNIDPTKIEQSITPQTRAIMPVHLYGNPCDMDQIMHIARQHGLKVVEDAAQAHGASYKGKPVGVIGDIGCFSFYPGKNLGAYGDAGAVVTDNVELAAKVRLLRDHGRTTKYEHIEIGYGERIDALQAAILGAKLRHLRDWTEARRKWAGMYTECLKSLPVKHVKATEGAYAVYHIYGITVEDRDGLLDYLNDQGVKAGIHYPIPLHLQPCYGTLGYGAGSLPVSEWAARSEISLPMYPELGEGNVGVIVGAVARFFEVSRS